MENKSNNNIVLALISILTIVFTIAKLFGWIHWSWLLVFSPTILGVAFWFLTVVVTVIVRVCIEEYGSVGTKLSCRDRVVLPEFREGNTSNVEFELIQDRLPKISIDGEEMIVVSCSYQYMTDTCVAGVQMITATVFSEKDMKQIHVFHNCKTGRTEIQRGRNHV